MLYRCWWNIILKYVQYHQLYGLIWTISFKSPNFLVTKKKHWCWSKSWQTCRSGLGPRLRSTTPKNRFRINRGFLSHGDAPQIIHVILEFFMMFHSTAVNHPAIGVPPWLRKPRPLRARCCRSHRRLRPQLASAARSLVDRSQGIDGPGAGLQEWRIPLETHKKWWFNVI